MNRNKGFIGIGLIIAIVLFIAVVGGGAYYLGKSGTKEKLKNNIITPISSQIRTSGAGGKDGTMQTNPDSSITIISPNGGENYIAGEKIIVKWETVDISPALGVWFHLDTADGKHLDNGDLVSSWDEILNTGEKTITIPSDIPAGQYKLAATVAMEIEDVSDNLFTINSASKNVSTVLPTKYLGSQNWPPVVKTSGFAYSCRLSSGLGDVPTVVEEKTINGKKYCVTSFIDAGAGSRFGEYTYTTPNISGSGTKITNFNLRWSSCGAYDKPESDQCQIIVSNFLNNLDAAIDSLMFI